MSSSNLDHLKEDLQFLDELDLDKIKFEISKELGPLSEDAALMLEAAESNEEIIPPEIQVRISKDGLKAYLTVKKLGKPVAIREEDITEVMDKNGIVAGIIESAIEEVLVEKLVGQEVLIAKGVPPTRGRDGEIKVLVHMGESKTKDYIDEKGRVDFKRLNQSGIVEKGEVVAEKIPAIPGKQGHDVRGKALHPEKPVEAEFVLSQDVAINPNNKRQLIALKGGILKKNFTIDEKVFLNGDIDYSTGNINYEKSIIIKGDVKSGFQVFCGEDIEIRGCVEDAQVVAEGDIIVKQGYLGDHKGYMKGSNITIGDIKQQEVFATGDLVVGGEAIHCDLHAIGFIKLIGVRGIAIGGQLIAGKGIELVHAGNKTNSKTLLRVGCDGEIIVIENQIEELKEKVNKAEKMHRVFIAAKANKGLSTTLDKMMIKLQETIVNISQEIENLEKKRLEKIDALIERDKPYIAVSHTVYPNTTIQIGTLKKLVTAEMRNKTFRFHNNQIISGA